MSVALPSARGPRRRLSLWVAYIVGTLTPTQAERVHLTGVDFHDSLGRGHWWRRGADHVTLDVRQQVSPNGTARPTDPTGRMYRVRMSLPGPTRTSSGHILHRCAPRPSPVYWE
jgi:hypothetical protein